MLFVNNLAQNGSEAQKQRWLPQAVDGSKLCGMCMSEPSARASKEVERHLGKLCRYVK